MILIRLLAIAKRSHNDIQYEKKYRSLCSYFGFQMPESYIFECLISKLFREGVHALDCFKEILAFGCSRFSRHAPLQRKHPLLLKSGSAPYK